MVGNFETIPGFCPDCGSIFPLLGSAQIVTCYNCKKGFPVSIFGDMEVEYTVKFNNYRPSKMKEELNIDIPDGPEVERKCPKCGHNKMSYATVQLRSADEGQTVFFTCTKCKFKESENS